MKWLPHFLALLLSTVGLFGCEKSGGFPKADYCNGECIEDEACTPHGECVDCDESCDSRECGDNGCGASCGSCASSLSCTRAGFCVCESFCLPQCEDRVCGPDGCGGTCGTCQSSDVCRLSDAASPETQCEPREALSPAMSFFVTSIGTGLFGGDLGGLLGADLRCQALADAAGQGQKAWRAFLADSRTDTGPTDRIGPGPWFNAFGERVVAEGCEATGCAEALGRDGIAPRLLLSERGELLDVFIRGSLLLGAGVDLNPTGNDCEGWFSSSQEGLATVFSVTDAEGRPARTSFTNLSDTNTATANCDLQSLRCEGGDGHFLCFAL